MNKYVSLEALYTQNEKSKANSSEAYKIGYEEASERACIDAQENYWQDSAEQRDQVSYGKRKYSTPRLEDLSLDLVYDDEGEYVLTKEDQEFFDDYCEGWNDSYDKHYKKMIELMESNS